MGKRIAGTRGGRKGGSGDASTLLRTRLEKHMHRKRSAIFQRCGIEAGDDLLARIDHVNYVGLVELLMRIIIGSMPLDLSLREEGGEVPNIDRKIGHFFGSFACFPGQSVIKRTVDTVPRGLAAIRSLPPDHGVSTTPRQGMEEGVICGADGTAQVRLTDPMAASRVALLVGELARCQD